MVNIPNHLIFQFFPVPKPTQFNEFITTTYTQHTYVLSFKLLIVP